MKYRYLIDFSDFECSNETILLHDTKYTTEEFNAICKDCIKESLMMILSNEQIQMMTSDGEIMEWEKYDFDEYISVWTNDNYNNLGYIRPDLFKLLKSKGFEIESLPIEAKFYANEYTYIRENFSNELVDIFNKKQELEKFPILSKDKSYELCSYLESNAKSVDEAIVLIKTWIDSNK